MRQRKFSAVFGNVIDVLLAVSVWVFSESLGERALGFHPEKYRDELFAALCMAQLIFGPLLLIYFIGQWKEDGSGEPEFIRELNRNAFLPVHSGISIFANIVGPLCGFVLPVVFMVVYRNRSAVGTEMLMAMLPALAGMFCVTWAATSGAARRVHIALTSSAGRIMLAVAGWLYVEILLVIMLLILKAPADIEDRGGGQGWLLLMAIGLGYAPARLALFYATGKRNLDFNLAVASILFVTWKLLF
ncbi:MAG TPA: hypothetical protein VFU15_00925 [Bacteroidia bacterium]|nr:hypothetical protein [Bacteroidia bacterium]